MFTIIKNLLLQILVTVGIISVPASVTQQIVPEPGIKTTIEEQEPTQTHQTEEIKPQIKNQESSPVKTDSASSKDASPLIVPIESNAKIMEKVSGQCGETANKAFKEIPNEGLCNLGESTIVTNERGKFIWQCSGKNGGEDASCYASVITDGKCGILSNAAIPNFFYREEDLCTEGEYTNLQIVGDQLQWSCYNEGGKSAQCYTVKETPKSTSTQPETIVIQEGEPAVNPPLKKTDAKCSDTNVVLFSPPTRCEAGTIGTIITTLSEYNWICNGINGGKSAQCSALRMCYKIGDGNVFHLTPIPCAH